MPAVVLPRADLPFPGSLREFQRIFPDDTACAAYLEAIRWLDGFVCGWCGETSEPYRFANRPQVLRCRKCQRDNALTAGTVMERTRTPGEHPVSYGTDKLSLNLVLLGVNRISMIQSSVSPFAEVAFAIGIGLPHGNLLSHGSLMLDL